jgi:daunorubicin resistance ABC transporter membrane protein
MRATPPPNGETPSSAVAAEPPRVVQVRVPERSWRHDARAVKIVWRRELIRFRSDRMRIFTALVQPALFLFVLGTGLSSVAGANAGGVPLQTFMYPGALAMTVLFTAVFSAGSIVWDREFGFLREMLVAPVSRWAIVVGKCLGGATVATVQGSLLLILAPLAGVPLAPALIALLLGQLLLLAFTLTAFGVVLAARVQQFPTFMGFTQMLLMPMFFLSGALFPLSGLPSWLAVLTRLNPLTYAVDPLRRTVFGYLDVTPEAARMFNPGVTWGGWLVPVPVELLIVMLCGVTMLTIAIAQFRRSD